MNASRFSFFPRLSFPGETSAVRARCPAVPDGEAHGFLHYLPTKPQYSRKGIVPQEVRVLWAEAMDVLQPKQWQRLTARAFLFSYVINIHHAAALQNSKQASLQMFLLHCSPPVTRLQHFLGLPEQSTPSLKQHKFTVPQFWRLGSEIKVCSLQTFREVSPCLFQLPVAAGVPWLWQPLSSLCLPMALFLCVSVS